MRAIVTGAAGFIGSTLSESLIHSGYDVVGVDCITDYYSKAIKMRNIQDLERFEKFEFHPLDLSKEDIDALLRQADVVFHLAGQPGVRASWGEGFREYSDWNILATQRILSSCISTGFDRPLVNASSSSIYGNQLKYPVSETMVPAPISPYGVTKLSAEHLVTLYGSEYGLKTVSLRFFTVFGPKQRPDMGIYKIIRAAIDNVPFQLNGTGLQERDFTFVDDIVSALRSSAVALAADSITGGSVFNVGSSSPTQILDLIRVIEEIVGSKVVIESRPAAKGDPKVTYASCEEIHKCLGWEARTNLRDGIARQVEFERNR